MSWSDTSPATLRTRQPERRASSPPVSSYCWRDLIVAECAYVLESFYRTPRPQVAHALRAIVSFGSIKVIDEGLLLRAVEVYELERLDFADAYLVACAETTGVAVIASFDRAIDRVGVGASRGASVTGSSPRHHS